MKMLRYQGRKNTDEASRMKCKRCKTQDVAYQDEKRRMQQIGAGEHDPPQSSDIPMTAEFYGDCDGGTGGTGNGQT